MRIRLIRRQWRALITGTLVVTLLWRALIPSGFMPAADGSLALTICPQGMPGMVVGSDAGHPHRSNHTEYCPFGAAPFAAPLPFVAVAAVPVGDLTATPAQRHSSLRPAVRSARAHQPRAPPIV